MNSKSVEEKRREREKRKTPFLEKANELRMGDYVTLRNGKTRGCLRVKQIVLEELYQIQQGRCEICQAKLSLEKGGMENRKTRAHLDHDHKNGKIRGLLCNSCNLMVGFGHDSPEVLLSGAEYLRKHQTH